MTWSKDHAIYLSTLEINVDQNEIEVVIKVFEDDLRDALRNFHSRIMDTSAVLFPDYVAQYFDIHLEIKNGEMLIEPYQNSVKLVGDSYQIKMSAQIVEPIMLLQIQADYFMELFPTQQNVLNLTFEG